ncbi:unnamed protein product [Ceutorhynchus assimilis]|uniref:Cytochrome P450 n=1 Tax=Ceutorhynchus assimilis TaxID=467358 RepID=A0A9N9MCW3_9CUCU|nr:unnamed protein product [Ceutorhynchus assimilis]
MYSISSVLIGCLIIFYIIFLWKNWKYVKFSWKVNGFFLPVLPFIGNTYISLLTGKKINPISLAEIAHKIVGLPVSFWFGHQYNYLTSDLNDAKIILNHPKCYDKAAIYDSLRYYFGDGLILAPYDIWKLHRRHFLKSFKPKMLKTYYAIQYRQSCNLVQELKHEKCLENIYEYFNTYSFTSFFVGTLGLAEDEMFADMGRIGQIVSEVQELLNELILNPVVPAKIWSKWFPAGKAVDKLINEGTTYAKEIIKKKKEQHKDIISFVENNNEVSLMDLLLTVDNQILSDTEIFNELMLLTVASTDTTGFTLGSCFILLAIYPDIQEKVYKEIIDTLADSYEDITNLKYTEAVLWETLRLFPPGPFIGRKCLADIDLGGKVLPAGASCLISAYHIHRDAANWVEPLKFDPARFLPENQSKIKPYSFLGFSAGPRDCIGKGLSMMQMKTTVANVVRNFKITTDYKSIGELQLESCVTMRVVNISNCYFEPRKYVA